MAQNEAFFPHLFRPHPQIIARRGAVQQVVRVQLEERRLNSCDILVLDERRLALADVAAWFNQVSKKQRLKFRVELSGLKQRDCLPRQARDRHNGCITKRTVIARVESRNGRVVPERQDVGADPLAVGLPFAVR